MKIKKNGWIAIFVVIAIIAAFFVFKNSGEGTTKTGLFSNKPTITVGVNTYAGFAPIVWLNGGLEPNDESRLTKDYGIRMKIVIQDDFVAGRNAFMNGDINLIYCTTDVLGVEMAEGGSMNNVRYVMMLNKSQGSDAMVVTKNIKTVADLRGKTIAVAEGTASHTLLLNILETNGLKQEDVKFIKVDNGLAAAEIFKAGQVDACVTWAPDDQSCVDAVNGARVLVSTKHAKDLITDGLIGNNIWLDENHENVCKLVSAILYANSELNQSPEAVTEAASVFAKAFGTDEEFVKTGCSNIWFATLGDQENFLGFNSNYTGIKAEEIYSKMSRRYAELNLTKSPLAWRKVSNLSFIEELLNTRDVIGVQDAQDAVTFTAVTEEIATKEAISDKQVVINFAVDGDVLDNNARAVIDKEFVGIAKQFNTVRIRIEGNTDNTGNIQHNKALSLRRAQSVANYLSSEYNFDKNRFIVLGNGPDHAIKDGVVGSNAQYRNTSFMLVTE